MTTYILNPDGSIKAEMHDTGTAGDQPTTSVEPPAWRGDKVRRFIGGAWREDAVPPAPPVDRGLLRKQQYPLVADQLDMLWHAMDRGELPRAEVFYETIKAVKDAYPKAATVFEVGPMPAA